MDGTHDPQLNLLHSYWISTSWSLLLIYKYSINRSQHISTLLLVSGSFNIKLLLLILDTECLYSLLINSPSKSKLSVPFYFQSSTSLVSNPILLLILLISITF